MGFRTDNPVARRQYRERRKRIGAPCVDAAAEEVAFSFWAGLWAQRSPAAGSRARPIQEAGGLHSSKRRLHDASNYFELSVRRCPASNQRRAPGPVLLSLR